MSNYLSIASVTTLLQEIIAESVGASVPTVTVSTRRPKTLEEEQIDPRVNIFLFSVSPNKNQRNADLPLRNSSGALVQRPRAALDLSYIITFYGDEETQEPERLLGKTVATLHSRPLISPLLIRDIFGRILENESDHFVRDSDLADETEAIRLNTIALNLEELSKIWSVFFQTPYAVSVAYRASVVFLETEESSRSAPPVQDVALYTFPFSRPEINSIITSSGETPNFFQSDSEIIIQGSGFSGEGVNVRIGETEFSPVNFTGKKINLSLNGEVPAGLHSVRIRNQRADVSKGSLIDSGESNVASLVLHPRILEIKPVLQTDPPVSEVHIRVTPEAKVGQVSTIFLNQYPTVPQGAAYVISALPLDANGEWLRFPLKNIKEADYLTRVQIDGAESPLTQEADKSFSGPLLILRVLRTEQIRLWEDKGKIECQVIIHSVVVQEDGSLQDAPMVGVDVSVTWTMPDGSTSSESGQTSAARDNRAFFEFDISSKKVKGLVTLTVDSVSKADYIFDTDNSVTFNTINVT